MRPRTARWILWIAAALLVPLPFFLVETGTVPAARLLMLGSVTLMLIAVEGGQGAVGIAAALLLAQAILYLVALWLLVTALLRPLRHRSPKTIALATGATLLIGIVLATTFEIYRTPFRTRSLHATVLHVYE
jgi:hypothetical protein